MAGKGSILISTTSVTHNTVQIYASLTLAFQAEFQGTFKVPKPFWLMKGIGRLSTSPDSVNKFDPVTYRIKLMKDELIISQCIHIEYKSKNSWYHSVFTLNTKVKLIESQCIHIEYKSKNSWNHSVFTLNTKVKTHGITVY
ncbi:hypothetical protein OUZ56_016285 [Daphnia magna]|uniref:Uncharacterized protein n=1 Tax=Daphnia magna TaxID=35525 RepID=A0ABR0AQA4_9CRUS|nr:hypothetical protein OUZ56_016285 [Daphnia magna]